MRRRTSGRGRAKPATARADNPCAYKPQEDAGFARVRSREAGPFIGSKVRSTFGRRKRKAPAAAPGPFLGLEARTPCVSEPRLLRLSRDFRVAGLRRRAPCKPA